MVASMSVPDVLSTIGDIRWLRGHVSTFFVGTVLLILVNLAVGTSALWSVTATGIWLILLAVHGIVVLIARLSAELVGANPAEETSVLPVKDGLIVSNPPDIGATWIVPPEPTPPAETETVSWQIATDAAQRRRSDRDETT